MKIKQGKTEEPLKLKGGKFETLEALCHRVGAVVRLKQEAANEEAEIKAEFAKLRPALEKAHGLDKTYTALNASGAIAVTMGTRSFLFKEKYSDPQALTAFLKGKERTDLLECFKISAAPIQKEVKNHLDDKVLRGMGGMVPNDSTVALKAV